MLFPARFSRRLHINETESNFGLLFARHNRIRLCEINLSVSRRRRIGSRLGYPATRRHPVRPGLSRYLERPAHVRDSETTAACYALSKELARDHRPDISSVPREKPRHAVPFTRTCPLCSIATRLFRIVW